MDKKINIKEILEQIVSPKEVIEGVFGKKFKDMDEAMNYVSSFFNMFDKYVSVQKEMNKYFESSLDCIRRFFDLIKEHSDGILTDNELIMNLKIHKSAVFDAIHSDVAAVGDSLEDFADTYDEHEDILGF